VSTEAVVRPDAVGRAAGDVREVRPWPARLSTRLDPPVALTMTWVPLVLLLDRGAGIWWQRLLGLGTWVLLLALLRREVPLVRAQVAVVIVFATVVEYTFSPVLEVYVYRLDNVPAFVPPGHGLVYLCALAMGRSRWVRERLPACVALTVVAGGAYAGWGLLVSSRPDALGAFWFACLVGFLLWDSTPIANDSNIHKDMKSSVKGPCSKAFTLIHKFKQLHIVDITTNRIGSPVYPIGMKFCAGVCNHFTFTNLRSFRVIICIRVNSDMYSVLIISNVFHNINFTGLWPTTIFPISWQHPQCRPGTPTGRKFCFYFNSSIKEISFIL
jgi:hypothetical protein